MNKTNTYVLIFTHIAVAIIAGLIVWFFFKPKPLPPNTIVETVVKYVKKNEDDVFSLDLEHSLDRQFLYLTHTLNTGYHGNIIHATKISRDGLGYNHSLLLGGSILWDTVLAEVGYVYKQKHIISLQAGYNFQNQQGTGGISYKYLLNLR